MLALAACGENPPEPAPDAAPAGASESVRGPVELAHFPLSEGAVPVGADAVFDPEISRDGGGSLRVESREGGRLRLYRLGELGPVSGRLLMTGFLKSRDLEGAAFFEMRCRPAVGNEAFVRGVAGRVEGSSDWKPTQMGFSRPDLCSNPVSVELNVVVDGSGTIWIDDLRLWNVPTD
jgi:hypothetical protein